MRRLLISLLILLSINHCDAQFVNSGTIRSTNSNISADTFVNTGTLEGLDNVDLECLVLVGDGLIKGPIINIIAKSFEYTGKIECDGECIITTDTPVENLKFTKVGRGKFSYKKYSEQN